MLDTLIHLTKLIAVKFLQMPLSAWIHLQWANLKFRETQHLLRLDDYLLKDMGLTKVDGRIDAIDNNRIDRDRPGYGNTASYRYQRDRVRHAD